MKLNSPIHHSAILKALRLASAIAILMITVGLRAEVYVGGSLGLGLFGDGGPQNYFGRNDFGVSRSGGSFNPFRGSILGGVWLGNNWGIELSGEVGPFNKGSGKIQRLYFSDYTEEHTFWSVFIGPEFRRPIFPGKLELVLGVPLGYQFLTGSVSNRFSSYNVSGSSIVCGVNVRLELMATKRSFGFFSVGYAYGRIPALIYLNQPNLLGGGQVSGSESILTSELNKNSGVDLSGVRLNLGFGFKWGFGQRSERMPAV